MSVITQQLLPNSQEQGQGSPQQKPGQQPRREKKTFLLDMPITKRLALGLFVPLLLAALAFTRVGILSQQLLSHEASYYQLLVGGSATLRSASSTLQLLHTNVQVLVSDGLKPQPTPGTIIEDSALVNLLSTRLDATIQQYLQQDMLDHYSELSSLFSTAGHGDQVQQQLQLTGQVGIVWQQYLNAQLSVSRAVNIKEYLQASYTEILQVEPAYTNLTDALTHLSQFTDGLAPSIQDALTIEENTLLFDAALAAASILLGIGIVAYLVFSTVVRRLGRTRRVIQAIEGGQMDMRLSTVGRDEITSTCVAVNGMLDTIVGLLEETRQQRDELANAEEFKRLHRELQDKNQELKEANERLAALATTDPLTGLANHRTMLNRIEEEMSRSRRTNDACALLFIDLDHFKRINDTWGHRAGDAVLCEVSRRLSSNLRREDFVGRYGGEEFAALLVNTGLDEAKMVGERLRKALAEAPCVWQPDDSQALLSIPITGSIGVAVFDDHEQTCSALIEAADEAMYNAKHSGRNRVCCAGEVDLLVHDVLADEEFTPDRAALQALVAAIQAFDQDTSLHAVRIMQLAEETAGMLGCSEEEQHLLRLAALMHDVGKIGVPQEILNKPGPLTEDEWNVMRRHPGIGRQILGQAGGQCALLSHIVVAHHERWDGEGYPYGLAGEAIPLGARILSVVDSYDAMISDRPYRVALSSSEAIEELRRCVGSQFDPQVVTAFLHILENPHQHIAEGHLGRVALGLSGETDMPIDISTVAGGSNEGLVGV